MSITTLISQSELAALGWTLLHFCWQGTAIAVAYAIADRLTSRSTSNVRYAVALTALALMPLAVVSTFAMELQVVRQQTINLAPDAAISGLPSQSIILQEIALTPEPTLVPAITQRGAWLLEHAQLTLPWIDALWILGVLMLALRAGGGWWQLERVRTQAAAVVPPELARAFRRIHQHLQIGREVTLRISGEIISPLAMGLWRTTIILPTSVLLHLSPDELESVLAHELGHIRRWDYAVNLLQTAIESVLFFHPAVWWLSNTIRELREICCDQIAVDSCANPIVYARALLRMEEQRAITLRTAVALHGCGGSLLSRIRQVLGEGSAMENMEYRSTSGVRIAAAAAVVMALLLGPKIGTAVAAAKPVTPEIALAPIAPQAPATQPAPVPIAQSPAPVAVPAQVPIAEPAAVPLTAPEPPNLDIIVPNIKVQPIEMQDIAPKIKMKHIELKPIEPKVKFKQLDLKPIEPKVKFKQLDLKPIEPKVEIKRIQFKKMNFDLKSQILLARNSDMLSMEQPAREQMMVIAGLQSADGKPTPAGTSYIDGMKDAGYSFDLNNDLHSLIALKSVGVTPEYAKAMNNVGLGKPTIHDLITLKALGITPEYVASLKQQGVTPLTVHDVISMKAQHVTPEYASWFKQHFPDAPINEMRRASIFHLDDKFLAQAKAHGFDDKDLNKLIRLKISGLLDD